MSKYGSDQVPFCFVGAFDLLDHALLAIDGPEVEAVTEETTGLGQSAVAHTPVGLRKAKMAIDGFFEDASGVGTLEALVSPAGVQTSVMTGVAGNVAGRQVAILSGAFVGKVSRQPKRGELHKAQADIQASGIAVLNGVLLQTLATKTGTWDTQGAESVDNGASSANGAVVALFVKACSGVTNVACKIRHSADDTTYADFYTFTPVTPWTPPAAPVAAAVQVATQTGTVNRHLAMSGTFTGAGSITLAAAAARL